jgi:hypothetical protein
MSPKLKAIMTAMVLAMFLVTNALAAEILVCISNKSLKGQETVGSCIAKSERFAVVDKYGIVRILTPEEIELTKRLNPKVFETRAFGLQYRQMAPKLPPMPVPSYVPGG